MQNLVIGIVLIVLALLVGAVFVFHQFGPDMGLAPPQELGLRAPDGEDSTLQLTVGGNDPRADELNAEAQRALSMDHAREIVEQQPVFLTPTERRTRDERGRVEHVVKKGETLISIAREYLGDATLWPQILEANRSLSRPEDLHEGQTILIPTKEAK